MTTNGSHHQSDVSAQRELFAEQSFQSLLRHNEQDQVHRFCTKLKAETAAGGIKKSRSASFTRFPGAYRGKPFAVSCADKKPRFYHSGEDNDGLGFGDQPGGNFLVGGILNFFQNQLSGS